MKKKYHQKISTSLTPANMKEHELNLKLREITDYIMEFNTASQEQVVILEDQVNKYKMQMGGKVLTPEIQEKYNTLVEKMDTNIANIKARLAGNVDNLQRIENAGSMIEKATILQSMEEQLNANHA